MKLLKYFKDIVSNFREDIKIRNKIVFDAKSQERRDVDKQYKLEMAEMRRNHLTAIKRLEVDSQNQLRLLSKELKKGFKTNIKYLEAEHKKDLDEKDAKIYELKKDMESFKMKQDKEEIKLKFAHDRHVSEIKGSFHRERIALIKSHDSEKSRVNKLFSGEIEGLKELNMAAQKKLKKARVGYDKYRKYAYEAMQLITDLKALSAVRTINTLKEEQQLLAINDQFESIERYNDKYEEAIQEMLSFSDESEDLIDELVYDENTTKKIDSFYKDVKLELLKAEA